MNKRIHLPNTNAKADPEKYLEKHFPKGDKRRGEAMFLLALARLEVEDE